MKITWLVIPLLIGCATTIMEHPSKASIDHDKYECMQEAEQRAANWGAHGNVFLMKDWIQECLEHRGWRVVK